MYTNKLLYLTGEYGEPKAKIQKVLWKTLKCEKLLSIRDSVAFDPIRLLIGVEPIFGEPFGEQIVERRR